MPASVLAPARVTATLGAIDQALELDAPPAGPSPGSGRASGDAVALSAALGALADVRGRYEWLAARHQTLLTAAWSAVVESRTSRRNPLTPIIETLAEFGELPGCGTRLSEVLPETAAAWPAGASG